MQKLDRNFYLRDAQRVARDLIGAILVHRVNGNDLRARVVETEAYVGPHDLACHAAKGRTTRTEVMFGPGGHAYVYFIYGMYDMLNVVTGKIDDPQAVLIRAAEPLGNWAGPGDLTGPGKLCRHMRITRKLNGEDLLGNQLWFEPPTEKPTQIAKSPRIGVDYAGQWRDKPLRFYDPQSQAVSGPKKRA
jgi:DNA-3-methyladenine glycosylase